MSIQGTCRHMACSWDVIQQPPGFWWFPAAVRAHKTTWNWDADLAICRGYEKVGNWMLNEVTSWKHHRKNIPNNATKKASWNTSLWEKTKHEKPYFKGFQANLEFVTSAREDRSSRAFKLFAHVLKCVIQPRLCEGMIVWSSNLNEVIVVQLSSPGDWFQSCNSMDTNQKNQCGRGQHVATIVWIHLETLRIRTRWLAGWYNWYNSRIFGLAPNLVEDVEDSFAFDLLVKACQWKTCWNSVKTSYSSVILQPKSLYRILSCFNSCKAWCLSIFHLTEVTALRRAWWRRLLSLTGNFARRRIRQIFPRMARLSRSTMPVVIVEPLLVLYLGHHVILNTNIQHDNMIYQTDINKQYSWWHTYTNS